MFGWLKKKEDATVTLTTFADVERLIGRLGTAQAGLIIRDQADKGNVACQIFLSQAGLVVPIESRPDHVKRETEHYTNLAANAGDPGSQFNLAKIYISKIDVSSEHYSDEDRKNIAVAKFWLAKAATQGFKNAEKILNDFVKAGL